MLHQMPRRPGISPAAGAGSCAGVRFRVVAGCRVQSAAVCWQWGTVAIAIQQTTNDPASNTEARRVVVSFSCRPVTQQLNCVSMFRGMPLVGQCSTCFLSVQGRQLCVTGCVWGTGGQTVPPWAACSWKTTPANHDDCWGARNSMV